jgi:hypothetical protein
VRQRIVGAALVLAWSTVTAMAEPVRMAQAEPMPLPAFEVVTIVRSAGFDPISPVSRRGEFYVLRAAGPDGREMRVIVDGRRGRIVSARPVVAAARGVPGERLGPYERTDGDEPLPPDGYIDPGSPSRGAPVVYEGDRPLIYDRRPAGPIPNVPPEGSPDRSASVDTSTIMREERGENGLLPPPPERFPQRVAPAPAKPAAKPEPVKRAAAAPPATPPLPRPRPAIEASKPAAPVAWPAETAPAQPPPASEKVDPRAVPH